MHMTRLLAGILTACVVMTSPLAAQTYETVTVHNTAGWPNVDPLWFDQQAPATIRFNMSPGRTWNASAPRIEITQPTIINRIAGAMTSGSNPGNNFANIEFKIHVHSNEQHFADHAQSGDVFNRSGGYVENLGENNLPPALGVVHALGYPVHWVEIGFEPFLLQPGSYVFNVQGYVYSLLISWVQTSQEFDAPADVYTDSWEWAHGPRWLEYGKDDYLAPLNPHAGIVIEGLVEVPQCPISADLNCDGVVDVSDLLILLANWGACPPSGDCTGDINEDGTVDVSDLLILLANWG